MSKHKRGKLRVVAIKPRKPITYDARVESRGAEAILKIHEKPSLFLEKIFIIARWDGRLCLGIFRILLFTIPMIILHFDSLLHWITGINKPLFIMFPYFDNLMKSYQNLYGFLWRTQLIQLLPILLSLGFISGLYKYHLLDKKINRKVTTFLVGSTLFNLYTLYGAIQFQVGFLQIVFYTMWVLLVIVTLMKFPAIRKYQKNHGPYDPGQLLKRARRKKK